MNNQTICDLYADYLFQLRSCRNPVKRQMILFTLLAIYQRNSSPSPSPSQNIEMVLRNQSKSTPFVFLTSFVTQIVQTTIGKQ